MYTSVCMREGVAHMCLHSCVIIIVSRSSSLSCDEILEDCVPKFGTRIGLGMRSGGATLERPTFSKKHM